MFDILFLGTGASVPSRDHGLPAVLVRSGPDTVLLDCGEGTQRQIMVSPYSFMKVGGIFITHLHGDHFYGLPGLIQTMGMMGRKDRLVVRGPEGTAAAVEAVLSVSSFSTDHGLVSQGHIVKEPDVRGKVDAAKAESLGISGRDFSVLEEGGTVNGVSMSDICEPTRKGKVLAYTGDTRPCPSVAEAVKGADVLIHEATYTKSEASKAQEFFHSTAAQAATVARDCGCGALFLVHISNRYKDRNECLKEAAEIFPAVYLPADLSVYKTTKRGIKSV